MCTQKGYHLMAKPMGPLCNLKCEYCFYLEKKELFEQEEAFLMSDAVLEAYIKKYMLQSIPEIAFTWQGGEPMLAGIAFYQKVVRLQRKYANGKRVTNAIQTNGTLLNESWCTFLKQNNFQVGLSLDGPELLHDKYRKNANGDGSFATLMKGLRMLQQYQIEYNVLACVTQETSAYPLEIYHFFKEQGVRYIQFTPVVERAPDSCAQALALHHAMPGTTNDCSEMMPWSVQAKAYGEFLCAIFDEWVSHDVGEMFVMNFEWALTSWLGLENTMCVFTKQCGGCAIVEHNGDIYSCDHYMFPQYRLGNILTDNPQTLMQSPQQLAFGCSKEAELSAECKKCNVLFACQGECPRHRFPDAQGNARTSYLCDAYRKFFRHINPRMRTMAQLVANNQPAARIMTLKESPLIIINK